MKLFLKRIVMVGFMLIYFTGCDTTESKIYPESFPDFSFGALEPNCKMDSTAKEGWNCFETENGLLYVQRKGKIDSLDLLDYASNGETVEAFIDEWPETFGRPAVVLFPNENHDIFRLGQRYKFSHTVTRTRWERFPTVVIEDDEGLLLYGSTAPTLDDGFPNILLPEGWNVFFTVSTYDKIEKSESSCNTSTTFMEVNFMHQGQLVSLVQGESDILNGYRLEVQVAKDIDNSEETGSSDCYHWNPTALSYTIVRLD